MQNDRSNTVGSHKTTVSTVDGVLRVTYHNTPVWAKSPTGGITLTSGGYMTRTTKLRMNQAFQQFGPSYYFVIQKKGEWFVGTRGTSTVVPFTDGMVLL